MLPIFEDTVLKADEKVRQIESAIVDCDEDLTALDNQKREINPLDFSTRRRVLVDLKAVLTETLAQAKDDVENVKTSKTQYDKSVSAAQKAIDTLEAEQYKNILATLQALDAAWTKALAVAACHHETQKVASHFDRRSNIVRRYTNYYDQYLQPLEKALTRFELDQTEVFVTAKIQTRKERAAKAAAIQLDTNYPSF